MSSRNRMGSRLRAHRMVGAFAMLLLVLLAWSTSAQALLQRGHVFNGTTIGSEGSENGQLSRPGAIAVNEASGDLYVADRGNNRVEIFGANGEFVASFENAKGAKISHPEAIAVDNSHASSPADDPSAGDVYVVQGDGVLKFDAQGKYLSTVVDREQIEENGAPQGVAVDPSGQVWVDFYESSILSFNDAAQNVQVGEQISSELEPLGPGLAVDSAENLYLRYEPADESTSAKSLCKHAPCLIGKIPTVEEPRQELSPGEPLSYELDPESASGVAVDTATDDPYVNNVGSVAAFDSTGTLIQRFGAGVLQEGSGIAVDAGTETVYVADAATGKVIVFEPAPAAAPTVDAASTLSTTSSSAAIQGQIDPHGTETTVVLQYSTSQCTAEPSSCAESFSCSAGPSECGEVPSAPADIGAAFGTQNTSAASATPAGLASNTVYYYRFVARNSSGLGAGAEQAFLTRPSAGLTTADARQWEQVSPVNKFGSAIEPITLEGGAVQASTDGSALAYLADGPVSATPESSRSPEATQILSTRDPAKGWSSQDIVTPTTEAAGVPAGLNKGEYLLFSPNLSLAIVEPVDANRFAAPPLSPPLTPREKAEGQERTISLRADAPISPEAMGSQIYEEAQANGLKLSEPGHVHPGYLPLVSDLNAPGVKLESTSFHPTLNFEGATPDLTHVVIGSSVALTEPEMGTKLPSPELRRLYEWSAGELQDVSVPPEGETAAAPQLGLGGGKTASTNVRHAISDDGSRVFWSSSLGKLQKRLYMRDTQTQTTVRIDVPNADETARGFTPSGTENATFQTASADGSKVFFTDSERLVEGSLAEEEVVEEEKPDLYVYEIATKKLTDLTIAPVPAGKNPVSEPASVREVVLGASEDGNYVYFVANGVLANGENGEHEKATPGHCLSSQAAESSKHRRESTCSLYADHFNGAGWEPPRFIATLSSEDNRQWTAEFAGEFFNLGTHTAGTSPDGNYLAFMSNRSLTGYDNSDVNSGQPDEEVFLYDAATNGLVCASCNPTGARPLGVHDTEASGEGVGLLVDRPESWLEHEETSFSSWLAASLPGWTTASSLEGLAYHQPNYLSNSGRLFFNSPDALAAQDTNGKEDVYEYEPEGVPKGRHMCTTSTTTFSAGVNGCIGLISSGSSALESAFLDASTRGGEEADGSDGQEGGGDVFFVTAAPLVPQDSDTTFDAYDAHECTTASPCLSQRTVEASAGCSAESSCKAPFSASVPGVSAPATGTSSGNLAAQSGVLANKTATKSAVKKPLTRAQKLKRALEGCRKLKRKAKRTSCQRLARKRYGAKRAKSHKPSSQKAKK